MNEACEIITLLQETKNNKYLKEIFCTIEKLIAIIFYLYYSKTRNINYNIFYFNYEILLFNIK